MPITYSTEHTGVKIIYASDENRFEEKINIFIEEHHDQLTVDDIKFIKEGGGFVALIIYSYYTYDQ